jgi:hypothetical protein
MTAQRASVQERGSDEDANRATVARSFDAWRAGTGSPYDLLAENATGTITGNSAAARSILAARTASSSGRSPMKPGWATHTPCAGFS